MPTTWRGQDGQVSIAGTPETVIGGVYAWTVVTEFAPLESTVMGNVWRSYRPGLPGWNGTMTARFDNTEGQDQLLATVTGLTPAGTLEGKVKFVINDQNDPTPGTRYLEGDVIITGVSLTAELENIIDASYTFQGNNELTLTWPVTP